MNSAKSENMPRRDFLSRLGWIGLGISGAIAALGNIFYLKPTVNYGSPTFFRIGKPNEFKEGIQEIFEKEKVMVYREKKGFAAISLTCTHLGCTVQASSAGFECPCHGSQFDNDGLVTGGPAPKPLPWFQINIAPNGELEVDKSIKVPQNTYYLV
jgi:cytochrome b6-f complex iron-sulfur subunit